ncbi:MAG: hypothetical protein ACTSYJ_05715 [Candidatus Thorarchaeota archaeon]
MSSLEYLRKLNLSKHLLILFILCTIVFVWYSATPMYTTPSITIESEPIPECELSITNDTWSQPERILLANLTPRLEDPSWDSSESRQGDYDARIETDNYSSTMFFYNYTAMNETYTWNQYARWSLMWPFAVLNYTELTAEWHLRVIEGNITAKSSFIIGRGYWDFSRGYYIDDSSTELQAFAGDTITLISSSSNFTEELGTIDIGLLWVDLGILAEQGSIVTVDNVEVWISTDEPLSSVTLDFQSLYGHSLFTNPSIVSQWLGTAYQYDFFNDVGDRLSFFLKSVSATLPYGFDLMPATRSNQTTYLQPGYYSLTLGWFDEYMNDEYIFNFTIRENTSLLMQIPLPFNEISINVTTAQIPGTVRLSYGVAHWTREYFNSLNLAESENSLMILPDFGSIFVQLSIPGKYWPESEFSVPGGAHSTIVIDFKLIPLFGIYFTSQQIIGMIIASIFAMLSLVLLLYRWHSSKDAEYLTLLPLIIFVIGLLLPWYTRIETYSGLEYMTYCSPILGYRLWQFESLFLTTDSLIASIHYSSALVVPFTIVYGLGFFCSVLLLFSKPIDFLRACSITTLLGGFIAFFTLGGVPWLGFWIMMVVPLLSHAIITKFGKSVEETPTSDESDRQLIS